MPASEPTLSTNGAKANAKTLWLSSHGTLLDAEGQHFVLRVEDKRPVKIPIRTVRQIIVEKDVRVRSRALKKALDAGVPVSFFGRCGELRGHLQPPLPPRVDLRVAQYRAFSDARTRLALARRVLHDKLESCHRILRPFARKNEAARHALLALEQAHRGVSTMRQLDELRGIEGAAARRYFQAIAAALGDCLHFSTRTRRPPTDPLNALLSYGYSVLIRDLAGKIEILGLDPYVGYLHEPGYNSPALALDLAEPLRAPVIDFLAFELFSSGAIPPEDFQHQDEAVLLGPEGKRAFFTAYEKRVRSRGITRSANPQGSLLHDVAESFAAHLREGTLTTWKPLPDKCRNHLSCDTSSATTARPTSDA